MQFYLLNIRLKLHHRKWRKLRITMPVNMAPFTHYFRYPVWEMITW